MSAIWHPWLAIVCFSAAMALLMGMQAALIDDTGFTAAIGLLNLGCAALNLWVERHALFPQSTGATV